MSREFPESDWKKYRALREVALQRFSEETLKQIGAIANDTSQTAHDRYGAIYGLIHQRDKDLADAFNGLSRSSALLKFALIVSYNLVSAEELADFTPQTREYLMPILNRVTQTSH